MAVVTGLGLTELLQWEPRDIATLLEIFEDLAYEQAHRDAQARERGYVT